MSDNLYIEIPASEFKKALFIVDAQPQTLKGHAAQETLDLIRCFLAATDYDAYVIAELYADENSMIYKQTGHVLSKEDAGLTDGTVSEIISKKKKPTINIHKITKSCFKAFETDELQAFLKSNHIEEIHACGFDINDCVLATAYDANDLGYFAFVIEEASHHYASIEELKAAAITILRRQNMTNNSIPTHFRKTAVKIDI